MGARDTFVGVAAINTITGPPCITNARKRPDQVITRGTSVTVVRKFRTLINIVTGHTVAGPAAIAHAYKSTNCVVASRMIVTRMNSS